MDRFDMNIQIIAGPFPAVDGINFENNKMVNESPYSLKTAKFSKWIRIVVVLADYEDHFFFYIAGYSSTRHNR